MTAKHILLVEDSEALRKVLGDKLREVGYAVLETGLGDEGYKIAVEQKPDLVITDLVMFPTDGIAMATKIRASGPFGAALPIIALTNQGASEEERRVAGAQFTKYFVKADTPLEDVVKAVQSLV